MDPAHTSLMPHAISIDFTECFSIIKYFRVFIFRVQQIAPVGPMDHQG